MAFTEGQRVTIMDNGEPYRVTKVSRVLKKYVELESGGKFRLDGQDTYPSSNGGYSRNSWKLEPWEQAHTDTIHIYNLRYRIHYWIDKKENRQKLTKTQLLDIAKVLQLADPNWMKGGKP